jgi:hypothetical protein
MPISEMLRISEAAGLIAHLESSGSSRACPAGPAAFFKASKKGIHRRCAISLYWFC